MRELSCLPLFIDDNHEWVLLLLSSLYSYYYRARNLKNWWLNLLLFMHSGFELLKIHQNQLDFTIFQELSFHPSDSSLFFSLAHGNNWNMSNWCNHKYEPLDFTNFLDEILSGISLYSPTAWCWFRHSKPTTTVCICKACYMWVTFRACKEVVRTSSVYKSQLAQASVTAAATAVRELVE